MQGAFSFIDRNPNFRLSNLRGLRMKRMLIAAATAALFIQPASAADLLGSKDTVAGTYVDSKPINWTGVYVGGQVGYSNANHDVSGQGFEASCTGVEMPNKSAGQAACEAAGGTWKDTPIDWASAFVNGFDSHGAFAGVRLGADWEVNGSRWLVGVLGDYNWSRAKTTVGAGSGSDSFAGDITDDNSWVAAFRAGYLFGEDKRTLLYGLVGYGQQDVSYGGSIGGVSVASFKDPSFHPNQTFSGLVLGVGSEYALNNAITIGLEYQHMFGGTQTIYDSRGTGDCPEIAINDKMQSDKIMGRVNFKIGPGVFGY